MRLTVRYSVIVLPNGFGARMDGELAVCCGTGDARVMTCLRSLSTVT